MEELFLVEPKRHGKGPVLYSWHPNSQYVASTGSTRVVHIFNRQGKLLQQIIPPSSNACIALEWDSKGETLAVLQEGASTVLLWDFKSKTVEHVTLNVRDATFMKWAKKSQKLAVGSGRGELLIYNKKTKERVFAAARHRKRVTCGDWNSDDKFAFASDDRQITITTPDGKTFGQVKVKSKPTKVTFGGNQKDRENFVSVSMNGKTILLYNLDDPENALELAFQQRYGHIIGFEWFKDGYVMVGFSLGYLVVISTHLDEIGREQFCARFHKDNLRDIAYCPSRHKVATCGDQCIKIVDMQGWKEHETLNMDAEGVSLDQIAWTSDGRLISVSSKSGHLYTYEVKPSELEFKERGSPPLSKMIGQRMSNFTLLIFISLSLLLLLVFLSHLIGAPISHIIYAVVGQTPTL